MNDAPGESQPNVLSVTGNCGVTVRYLGFCIVLSALCIPRAGAADSSHSAQEKWRFEASVYLYLPTINTTTEFPADSSGSIVNISGDQILENLETVFMGSLEIRKGAWGGFTDAVYLDIAADQTRNLDFSIDNAEPPAGTTVDISYAVRGLAWTVAGEYQIADSGTLIVDAFAGARLFDLEQDLQWSIAGNPGALIAARTGKATISDTIWDGILGMKGRYAITADRHWSLPFYLDVGGGGSALTWQAAAGISYSFDWVRVNALWRHLSYELPTGSSIATFNFGGPQASITFSW